jgi:hypothetical protein
MLFTPTGHVSVACKACTELLPHVPAHCIAAGWQFEIGGDVAAVVISTVAPLLLVAPSVAEVLELFTTMPLPLIVKIPLVGSNANIDA